MAPPPPLEPQSPPTTQLGAGSVRRRHVLFVPGYDPNAPRRYRELYRREGEKQAQIAGYTLAVSALKAPSDTYGWQVVAHVDGAQIRSEIEFMAWEDIVRGSMSRSIAGTYWAMLRTLWIYASTGALWRLIRLRPAPMLAAVYPIAALIVQLALALLLAWAGATVVGYLMPGWMALAAGCAVAWWVLVVFRRVDRRLFVHYLMLDYAFTASALGAWPAPLDARINAFAQRITALRARKDLDEILVVGHSSGAQIAVSALARHLAHAPPGGVQLGFLSLGQVIPMVSFLPKANVLRGELRALSQSQALVWVDVSAPGDGGCFALTDPVSTSGVAPQRGKHWPKVISAAFSKTMSPQWRKATRWKFFRRHFQYLCAFDHPQNYDYFAITAGPRTLAARFGGRAASRSRRETPLSGYRSWTCPE